MSMGTSLCKSPLCFYRITKNNSEHNTFPYFLSLPNFVSAYSGSILFALEALLPFNYNPLHLLISESFILSSFLEWHFNRCLGRRASESHLRPLGKPQKSAAGWVTGIT